MGTGNSFLGNLFRELEEHEKTVLFWFAPLVGYCLAYSYQYGFFMFYDLPFELIDLSVGQIVVAVFWVLLTIPMFQLGFNYLEPIRKRLVSKYQWPREATEVVSGALLLFLAWLLFGNGDLFSKLKITAWVVGILFVIVLSLGFFWQRFPSHRPSGEDPSEKAMQSLLGQRLPKLFSVALPMAAISLFFGYCAAARRTGFTIVHGPDSYVVVASTSSDLICAPYDAQQNVAKKCFIIISKSSPNVTFLPEVTYRKPIFIGCGEVRKLAPKKKAS